MELIEFLGKRTGFWIMLAVLLIVFVVIMLIVLKSAKKNYTGRIMVPVFFIELGIVFGIMALGFPDKGDVVGPGVVPGLWIIGLLGLSIFLLIRVLIGQEEEDPAWGHVGKVGIMIGMIILYLFIMQIIGYFIATAIFLIGSMYYLSYRNWKVMIIMTASWLLISYFAFYRLLYVPLPKGALIELIF
jgi:putative tricarboxylic transport membrane protein